MIRLPPRSTRTYTRCPYTTLFRSGARSKDEVDAADRLDWRLMLPLFAIVSLYAAGIGAVLPVLPFYLREMGASPLVIGLVLATEASSQSAASPMLGQLSDRFGRKRVLLASQTIAVVSLLLLALAQSIFTVLLARFLFGLTAGNFSAAAAYAPDTDSPETPRSPRSDERSGGKEWVHTC